MDDDRTCATLLDRSHRIIKVRLMGGGWGIEGGGRDVWDPVAESEFAPTDPISSLCRTFPISSLVLVRGVRAFKYRETWTFHIV